MSTKIIRKLVLLEENEEKINDKIFGETESTKSTHCGASYCLCLGWTGWTKLSEVKNYYQIKQIFPSKTYATEILDGDTITIKNGLSLRLLGINAPGRGEDGYQLSKDYLQSLVKNKELSLEYDQYQDDKFGRILAYVWIPCAAYVQVYCRGDRALVNEIMNKKGLAKKVVYEKRKKLKYEDYFN